jgi:hypothetical protein
MANTLKLGAGKWATGKDTVLSFNDENGNFKPLPFSFSRASSATVVNQSGLIETVGSGEPRIDFKDNTKGALLLEPSRTNSILQSNQFDTTWTISNASVVGNQNGIYNTTDAWKLVGNGANNDKVLQNVASGTSTFSIYAKAGNSNFSVISLGNGFAYYNIETGVVTSSSGVVSTNIESIGNGWYRLSITVALTSSSNVQVYIASADGSVVTNNGDFIYLQHAQLEVGSYATSIIPTQGSAVTRVADACSQTVPDGVIGQTEGTVFAQVGDFPKEHNGRIFAISDGTADTYITIIRNGSNKNFAVYVDNGGAAQVSYTGSGTFPNNSKIAVGYANNNYAIYINGIQVHTDTTASVPSCNQVFVGQRENGSVTFTPSCTINQTKLYNTRLSNAELAALTQ